MKNIWISQKQDTSTPIETLTAVFPVWIVIALSITTTGLAHSGAMDGDECEEQLQKLVVENDHLKEALLQERSRLRNVIWENSPALWDIVKAGVAKVRPLYTNDLQEFASILNEMLIEKGWTPFSVKRVDDDTVYITLEDPIAVTENSGSSGARAYFVVVVFSLTSINTIDYVWFDIPGGSHAMPGRFGRANFIYWIP